MTAAGQTPVQCAAGGSTLPDLEAAVREAIAAARAGLGEGDIDLALVFVSAAYGAGVRPVMDGLSDLIPARALLGTTAEGVLANGAEHERGPAVAVWLARLPGATIAPFALQYGQTQDGGTFVGWPRELETGWPEAAAVLLLADPFSFPVDALIDRLEEDHPGVPILGGMASGGDAPGGNTLVEYRDAFRQGDFLVRNVVGADPESGVIAVGDLMRTGQTIQFHVRDAASADADLRRLLCDSRDKAAPAGAIVFTCNGRGTRLFDAPDHDARCVRDCLGPIPVAGFFAQGEIGPIGSRTFLHGFTASIAVFETA